MPSRLSRARPRGATLGRNRGVVRITRRELLHLTAVAVPAVVVSACGRSLSKPSPGTLATEDVEISGVLQLNARALVERERAEGESERLEFEIAGDGHHHVVPLSLSARHHLRRHGVVVVRSGPATSNAHSHWIRVTVV